MLALALVVGALFYEPGRQEQQTRQDVYPTSDYTSSSPSIFYGVTIDRINKLDQTIEALERIPGRLTSRIVFDEYIEPATYAESVDRLSGSTDLMGEILDSFYVKDYSLEAYRQRAEDYVEAFGDQIAVWEVGNEINGEWLLNRGESRSDIVDKVVAANDVVRQHGGTTAITLYYNEGCAQKPEHEIFTWVRDELPVDLKENVDYVLVSYYEDQCNHLQPDWQEAFERLRAEFPSAKLGFGEVGIANDQATTAQKADYLRRYYAIRPNVDGFVGGYFWWHFWQDMVAPLARGDSTMIDALAAAMDR